MPACGGNGCPTEYLIAAGLGQDNHSLLDLRTLSFHCEDASFYTCKDSGVGFQGCCHDAACDATPFQCPKDRLEPIRQVVATQVGPTETDNAASSSVAESSASSTNTAAASSATSSSAAATSTGSSSKASTDTTASSTTHNHEPTSTCANTAGIINFPNSTNSTNSTMGKTDSSHSKVGVICGSLFGSVGLILIVVGIWVGVRHISKKRKLSTDSYDIAQYQANNGGLETTKVTKEVDTGGKP